MRIAKLENRLKALEKNIVNLNHEYPGAQFVGRYYDELTPDERYLWLSYYESLITNNVDVEAYEAVITYFGECPENLHFICEPRMKPATEAEFKQRVNEVREYIEELINEERS